MDDLLLGHRASDKKRKTVKSEVHLPAMPRRDLRSATTRHGAPALGGQVLAKTRENLATTKSQPIHQGI
jgi:hypothetical protein